MALNQSPSQNPKTSITGNLNKAEATRSHFLARSKALSESRFAQEKMAATPRNAELLWQQTFNKVEAFAGELDLQIFFRYSKSRGYSLIPGRELMIKHEGRIYPIEAFHLDTEKLRELKNPQELMTEVIRSLMLNAALFGIYKTRTPAAINLLNSALRKYGNISLNEQTWKALKSAQTQVMKRPHLQAGDYVPPTTLKPAFALAARISENEKKSLKKQNLLDLPADLPEKLKNIFVQEADYFNDVLSEIDSNNPDIRAMIGKISFYSQLGLSKDCFKISKETSGEWQLAVHSLHLNGKKTAIPPLKLALSDGQNLFLLREHLVSYVIQLLKILTKTLITEKLRSKIEFSPANDPDLRKIEIKNNGTIFFAGKPIRDFFYRDSVTSIISYLDSNKIKFIKRNNNIIFGTETIFAGKRETHESDLVIEGGNAFLKTSDRVKYQKIESQKFINGRYDKDLASSPVLELPPIINSSPFGRNLPENLQKQLFANLKNLYGLLKIKPQNSLQFRDLLGLLAVSAILNNKNHGQPELLGKLINSTGGTNNFCRALQTGPMMMFTLAENITTSARATQNFIHVWNLVLQNGRFFRNFNPANEATYVLIGMYSDIPRIGEIFKAILQKNKIIDLQKDKSLLINVGRRLKHNSSLSAASALMLEEKNYEKEKSVDPLALKQGQKISMLTFADTTVENPQNAFYLRQALKANYGSHKIGSVTNIRLPGGITPNPLAIFKNRVLDHIRLAITNNSKLFITIDAHGDRDSMQTSLGNILGLIITALKKAPQSIRTDFIKNNLIIGTSQCYGGSLQKHFQKEFGLKPHFTFSESGSQSPNMTYPNSWDKISQGSKFLRVYYHKTQEFAKLGYWSGYHGQKIMTKPTLTRVLHYLDHREKTLDIQINLGE